MGNLLDELYPPQEKSPLTAISIVSYKGETEIHHTYDLLNHLPPQVVMIHKVGN